MSDSERYWTIEKYQDVPLHRVKSACLKVFQALGALRDEIILLGGLVPAIIIDQSGYEDVDDPAQAHVGTWDVDIGFSLGIIGEERYDDIVKRLERSNFERDENEHGNPTNHRWKIGRGQSKITVDFQIPEDDETPPPGKTQRLTPELSAIVTPGLELAFKGSQTMELSGTLPEGDRVVRDIHTCGPAGLLLLKGLAIGERDKYKDYYDIFYLLRNWPGGKEGVVDWLRQLQPLDERNNIPTCIENLRRDFQTIDFVGPRNVARFFFGEELDRGDTEDQDQLMRQSQLIVDNFVSAWENS